MSEEKLDMENVWVNKDNQPTLCMDVNIATLSSHFVDINNVSIYMTPGCEDLIPTKAHEDDAGFDLKAATTIHLDPYQCALVPTGVHVIMEPKYVGIFGTAHYEHRYNMCADVRSRSGMALKRGLIVLNSPGTIDQSYRGEIGVIMFNTTNKPQDIARGERIAQLVFLYTPIVKLNQIDQETFNNTEAVSDRGSGGFGSTGK